eukprot:Gregarina_sp_Poly_1__3371@NODE_1972_length_2951_cov_69_552705_g1270_i0_p1_GENE_NODE_1972_length_2951_cov_69_552705_g1270_i0NODE_1972_length_2951_cov_69_552705_g1270_i0_p1_ORF_typecomplete_len230_score23_36_NODE_1972_length_2951_cov_69_552705_g1270_i021852874
MKSVKIEGKGTRQNCFLSNSLISCLQVLVGDERLTICRRPESNPTSGMRACETLQTYRISDLNSDFNWFKYIGVKLSVPRRKPEEKDTGRGGWAPELRMDHVDRFLWGFVENVMKKKTLEFANTQVATAYFRDWGLFLGDMEIRSKVYQLLGRTETNELTQLAEDFLHFQIESHKGGKRKSTRSIEDSVERLENAEREISNRKIGASAACHKEETRKRSKNKTLECTLL